jgi:mannose-6-phosphate isomerase class I
MLTMDQNKKPEVVVAVRPLYSTMQGPKRFRDSSDDESGSQLSVENAEAGTRATTTMSRETRIDEEAETESAVPVDDDCRRNSGAVWRHCCDVSPFSTS